MLKAKKALPPSMAAIGIQSPHSPQSSAGARARFFNSANAFALEFKSVPNHTFVKEPQVAFLEGTKTGFIDCDLSAQLGCPGPATTPLLLARYAKISPNENLLVNFIATASIWYVIKGSGQTLSGDEKFFWSAGDVFLLPGGIEHNLNVKDEGAVLWLVTNEPHLTFEGLRPSLGKPRATKCVHYPQEEILRQLQMIYEVDRGSKTAGMAILFSSEERSEDRNILPSLTLAMNSLAAGSVQPPHKHNSVAVALIIDSIDCYSLVSGDRKDWTPWGTTVTPPGAVHSHHNNGKQRALFLIVQDGGLHNHMRTMDFAFA